MATVAGSMSVHGVEVERESDGETLIAYTVQAGDRVVHAGLFDPACMGESEWDALAIGTVVGQTRKGGTHALHGHGRGSGVR